MKSKCSDCVYHLTFASGSVCEKQVVSFPVVQYCMFYESNESDSENKMSLLPKLTHKKEKEKEKSKQKKQIEQEYVSSTDKTKYVFYSFLPQRGE